MLESEIDKRVLAAAQMIKDFVDDRLHRWTKEISDAKSGVDAIQTSKKREFTRNIFYNKVGTGSLLVNATVNQGFYVNSINSFESKKVHDHILPPQLLGEFFLDKLCGYHTEKDTSRNQIKYICAFIRNCFKVIEVPDKSSLPSADGKKKSLNLLLSYHSCYSDKAINHPENYIPIIISQKYKYLNECSVGVKNSHIFLDNLTIMKDNREATAEELAWLFGVEIEGFDEWQIEKYNAESYDYESHTNETGLIIPQNNKVITSDLTNFM